MNGKKVVANISANVVYAILLVVALFASEMVYQIIGGFGTMSESILSLLVASAVIFLPGSWIVNKFIVKSDWSDGFFKIVYRQMALLGVLFLFLVLAIIVGTMNRIDLAEPIVLLILTILAMMEIKLIVFIMKNRALIR